VYSTYTRMQTDTGKQSDTDRQTDRQTDKRRENIVYR